MGHPRRRSGLITKIGDGNFRTDDRADLVFLGGGMKAWRTVDTVAIEQGDSRHAQLRSGFRQFLGERGAFEKTEGRSGMEFNVSQS